MFANFIDKQFEKLGYRVTYCAPYKVEYKKDEVIGKYTHVIYIGWKASKGLYVVQSYEEGTNSDGYNNCVHITKKELLLIYLRMWFM